jgi:starch synthase
MSDGSGTPLDASRFEMDIAAGLVEILEDPDRARAMGQAGRRRAVEAFSWPAIATQTLDLYRGLR